jgi:hypothetical protein
MHSLPQEIICIIGDFLFANTYSLNCSCIFTESYKDLLAFMYTCKYVYYIFLLYPPLWRRIKIKKSTKRRMILFDQNVAPIRKDIPPNDPRRQFCIVLKIHTKDYHNPFSGYINCKRLLLANDIGYDLIPFEFLNQLEYYKSDAENHYAIISTIPFLENATKVHLCYKGELGLDIFTTCKKLQKLYLCNCKTINQLDYIPNILPNLTRLHIPYCKAINKDHIQGLPFLEYICIHTRVSIREFLGHPRINTIVYYNERYKDKYTLRSQPLYYTLDLLMFSNIILYAFEASQEEIVANMPCIGMIQIKNKAWLSRKEYVTSDLIPLA